MAEQNDNVVTILMTGGIWKTPGVAEEPEITVVRWRVLQIIDGPLKGQRHVVGFNEIFAEGRVSTAIVSVDFDGRRCFTASGRVYYLHGPSGIDRDAEYVWRWWSAANGVEGIDVSSEFEPVS